MLINVLTDLSADTGLDLVNKRTLLLRLANRAAKEMHKELECTKIYREITLVVPPDKIVALPALVGELRGMRMHTNELPFDLASIASPRYTNNTLQHKFKNWRDLGESATHTIPAVGPITFQFSEGENTSTFVKVDGQTTISNRTEESVELVTGIEDVVENGVVIGTAITYPETTNSFGPNINSISCTTQRKYDVIVLDCNGVEIATLYNNYQNTRYKIVDVSQVFWTLDTSDGQSLIDVLYKVPQTDLLNDGDQFYAGEEFDEAWYNMAMYFFLKPLQNRQDDAIAHRQACLGFLISAKESNEQGIMKKVVYGRNKFYGIFKKYRYYPGSVTNVDHNIQA